MAGAEDTVLQTLHSWHGVGGVSTAHTPFLGLCLWRAGVGSAGTWPGAGALGWDSSDAATRPLLCWALLGSAHCVLIPETQVGQGKWASPAVLLSKLGFRWCSSGICSVAGEHLWRTGMCQTLSPFWKCSHFHPGSSLLLFRCILIGL